MVTRCCRHHAHNLIDPTPPHAPCSMWRRANGRTCQRHRPRLVLHWRARRHLHGHVPGWLCRQPHVHLQPRRMGRVVRLLHRPTCVSASLADLLHGARCCLQPLAADCLPSPNAARLALRNGLSTRGQACKIRGAGWTVEPRTLASRSHAGNRALLNPLPRVHGCTAARTAPRRVPAGWRVRCGAARQHMHRQLRSGVHRHPHPQLQERRHRLGDLLDTRCLLARG